MKGSKKGWWVSQLECPLPFPITPWEALEQVCAGPRVPQSQKTAPESWSQGFVPCHLVLLFLKCYRYGFFVSDFPGRQPGMVGKGFKARLYHSLCAGGQLLTLSELPEPLLSVKEGE